MPRNASGDRGDGHSGQPTTRILDLTPKDSAAAQSQLDHMRAALETAGQSSPIYEDCHFLSQMGTTEQFSPTVAAAYASVESRNSATNAAEQLPYTPHATKIPFRKWVETLNRRRHIKQQRAVSLTQLTNGLKSPTHSTNGSFNPRFSSSTSSFAFVSATRDASISLASMSLRDPSWRQTQRSSKGLSRTDRSSRASASVRQSEDSAKQLDPAVFQRSMHRRQILEELIKTEEGYIADVQFLMRAYFNILASSQKAEARSCISHSLADIVQLHEEILEDLHKLVPDADTIQARPATANGATSNRHHRWQSLDAVPEHRTEELCQQQSLIKTTEPSTAAAAAKIFARKLNRFYVYEEYGAQYNSTAKNLETAFRSMSNWETNQKGLETLAHILDQTRDATASHKAMAISDLLAKPVQRVCRYPLLFTELLKCTPIYDSPEAHIEIDSTLTRLREVTSAMNQAINDTTAPIEKTKLLQERLAFPNQKSNAWSKSRIRAFGRIQLCGVLYVCWQTKTSVQGKYMICLLYRSWLCLAVAEKADRQYTIEACIPLDCCSIEETDNRRGLQCHTAPFSWKLVFESNNQLYEIIMAACSQKEDWEWRDRLSRRIGDDTWPPDVSDTAFLALDIKSFGTILDKPGTIARQLSIRRAATVGSKSQLCQVIIQNTSVVKNKTEALPEKACINRSRSLQNSSRIPVLAPPCAERARLEALVSDVWSRGVLPFPGLRGRARREHHVRSSASSLMQRISASSLASTFGKRSVGRAGARKATAGVNGVDAELPQLSQVFSPATGITDDGKTEEEQILVFDDDKDTYYPVVQAASHSLDPPSELPHPAERSREWWKRGRSPSHPDRRERSTEVLSGRKAMHNKSDSSLMSGGLRRKISRFFEENKRHECEAEETESVFDKDCNMEDCSTTSPARSASRGWNSLPTRRSRSLRPGVPTESMRCASAASVCTDESKESTVFSSQTTAYELMAPLTRLKRHASPSSPCPKRPVVARGSIRKSFRSLAH